MKKERDFLIVTNNPMVPQCMGHTCAIWLELNATYRDVLIIARDLVYAGHTLYTHPLSGSVKPNETPYKSVVVSKALHAFEMEHAEIISNAVAAYDKFDPERRALTEQIRKDFQLIDYTLLSGAIDFDAVAGLSKMKNNKIS